MTQEHPITPPPELVREWIAEWSLGDSWAQVCQNVALVAARWGADQELKACCAAEHTVYGKGKADWLRSWRRPKPPSLKVQALALINHDPENQPFLSEKGIAIIRHALESLPD